MTPEKRKPRKFVLLRWSRSFTSLRVNAIPPSAVLSGVGRSVQAMQAAVAGDLSADLSKCLQEAEQLPKFSSPDVHMTLLVDVLVCVGCSTRNVVKKTARGTFGETLEVRVGRKALPKLCYECACRGQRGHLEE
ncbi:hypothetical protein GE061_007616 [Apolygus lucorum]|uniref:Uncharacterized protein n=1 Tax=Apolygus lucorum TaxID=248454 RepID=A0A8S9WRN1_APOLU|nr:hypothetical protein GE061_007616 [Apolygus lucorum]